jgi:hypothetical protein
MENRVNKKLKNSKGLKFPIETRHPLLGVFIISPYWKSLDRRQQTDKLVKVQKKFHNWPIISYKN